MADEILKRDQNSVTVLAGVTNDSEQNVIMLRVDPVTKRLLCSFDGTPGSGTVTSVSFDNANGFTGSVAGGSSTPTLSLGISISGMIKGSAGAIVQAISNVDYQLPITVTTEGTSGPASFDGLLLNIPEYGGVAGPGGATDNAISRYNGVSGDSIQNSEWTIDDNGKMSASISTEEGFSLTTSMGAGAGNNLMLLQVTNTAWDRPILRINNPATSGGATHIRLDGVAPQIEMVEDDQIGTDGSGKFEIGVNGDVFYISGRNSTNTSFEDTTKFDRQANGGGMRLYGTTSGYTKLVGPATGSSKVLTLPDKTGTLSYDYQLAYIGDGTFSPNSAANVHTANRAWFKAITVNQPCTVTGIRIGIAVSSGNIDVGIYDSSLNRLGSSGDITMPTGNTKTTIDLTSSVSITPGIYYLAIACNNTTATFSRGGLDTILGLGYQASAMPLPSTATLSYEAIGGVDRSFAIVGIVTGGLTA